MDHYYKNTPSYMQDYQTWRDIHEENGRDLALKAVNYMYTEAMSRRYGNISNAGSFNKHGRE